MGHQTMSDMMSADEVNELAIRNKSHL